MSETKYPIRVAPHIDQFAEGVFVWYDEAALPGGAECSLIAAEQALEKYGESLQAQADEMRGGRAITSAAQTEQQSPAMRQVLELILEECRYWQGRDEARRGGFAGLYAKAKEIADNAAPTPTNGDGQHE